MRKLLITAIGLMCFDALAADVRPFDGPKPLAILIQVTPRRMVIGSDTPRVAVYEDGEIIFLKKTNGTFTYYHRKLAPAELAAFKKRLAAIGKLKDLKRFYDASFGNDLPSVMFYLRTDQQELVTQVYGLRCEGQPKFAPLERPDWRPHELRELHRFLCRTNFAGSKPWIPKYIEVIVRPYPYPREASMIWPRDWPGLKSDRAFGRADGQYSIFTDGTILPDLLKFLGTSEPRGPVKIEGRNWAVAYRFTFPSEPVWWEAFEKFLR